jgi:hypothetical protein
MHKCRVSELGPLSPRETCRLPQHNPTAAAFFPRAVADLTLRSDKRRRVTRAASPQPCPAPAPATLPRASAQAAAEAQMQGERFFPRAVCDLTHAALRHTPTGCKRGPVLQPPPRTAPLPLSLRRNVHRTVSPFRFSLSPASDPRFRATAVNTALEKPSCIHASTWCAPPPQPPPPRPL